MLLDASTPRVSVTYSLESKFVEISSVAAMSTKREKLSVKKTKCSCEFILSDQCSGEVLWSTVIDSSQSEKHVPFSIMVDACEQIVLSVSAAPA